MGLPFKLRRGHGKDGALPPREQLDSISKQNEALGAVRGRVITFAILAEQELSDVIAKALVGSDNAKVNSFKELVIGKEFFTFMNKWKLFRDLTERGIIRMDSSARKELLEKLKKIIETRDQLAHGDIVFEGTAPFLEYLHAGKRKSVALDDRYFEEFNSHFGRVMLLLEQAQGASSV